MAEEEAVLVKERDLYSAGELYGARNVFGDRYRTDFKFNI